VDVVVKEALDAIMAKQVAFKKALDMVIMERWTELAKKASKSDVISTSL
jgi:hypothetical protein